MVLVNDAKEFWARYYKIGVRVILTHGVVHPI